MPKYRLGRLRGEFCAVHYDAAGNRHRNTLGTDNKIAAAAAVDKLNEQEERKPGQTVQSLWDAYREEKKGRRIAESMVTTWKALKGTFGEREAESIGDQTCQAYIDDRRKLGKADGTIWTELNHLRIVVSWSVKRGRILRAPFIAMPRKPDPRQRWLTREDVGRLKNAASAEHIRLFIILAIATGGRKEALLTLKWDQVDFVRGIIHLDDQKAPHKRKGRASVPMNRTILAALQEARKAALSGYVIEWCGNPVKSVKRSLAKTAENAGLKDVTAHVFRHSAAIWMVSDGIPMAKVAQYLGHSDDRITQRVYARYAPSHMQDAADSLNLDFDEVKAS
ncbi:site-specific integrase [Mesorhizobium sp.]|uniref:tyrosine-type recombinase/integrase n=1 Tax=Mesorhizobium sp. TaxID=1871066 RepID=UPI000FE8ABB3|nr:site-specific integrase [Mesorhizobium sp.]RWN33452.1 MAG: site-specific integrase [Mesorhizobium sp.]